MKPAQIHIQTHGRNKNTHSAKQRRDGQRWHLAGGAIRWWRRVGQKRMERGGDEGGDGGSSAEEM